MGREARQCYLIDFVRNDFFCCTRYFNCDHNGHFRVQVNDGASSAAFLKKEY